MRRNIIKDWIPPYILRKVTGLFYGWHGEFKSWGEAMKHCKGYNDTEILEKVRASALQVKNGSAIYERDSVIFDHIEYSFPLLSGLLWVACQKNNKLNVLDFGGSLGSSYYQNKFFLDCVSEVNWCVVEQPDFIDAGRKDFENDRLHFFKTMNDCFKTYKIDVILLSSVLQYLEQPYALLAEIIGLDPEYIIVDRTPFIQGNDRITAQKVNPSIYRASYPCWFFNRKKFLSFMSTDYKPVTEFDALDKANIASEFKGFIFTRNVQ